MKGSFSDSKESSLECIVNTLLSVNLIFLMVSVVNEMLNLSFAPLCGYVPTGIFFLLLMTLPNPSSNDMQTKYNIPSALNKCKAVLTGMVYIKFE